MTTYSHFGSIKEILTKRKNRVHRRENGKKSNLYSYVDKKNWKASNNVKTSLHP